jgi:hypothetical protein
LPLARAGAVHDLNMFHAAIESRKIEGPRRPSFGDIAANADILRLAVLVCDTQPENVDVLPIDLDRTLVNGPTPRGARKVLRCTPCPRTLREPMSSHSGAGTA